LRFFAHAATWGWWLGRQLVYEAGGDLVQRAATVSVAQAEKDLAAARFDVVAERARAVARIAALESSRRG
jgi:hypothetical protein